VVARVSGLTVAAGDRRLAGPVDLAVADGERVGLVGASGSGKSLLVAALLDELPAGLTTTGSVQVAGRAGAVFQDGATALDPLARVGAQLTGPLRRLRGLSRAAAREHAAGVLDRLGLPPGTLRAWPATLSGGQRQRVALALALAGDPRLLVADEPTTALDTVGQAAVLDLLDALAPALVLVSHDLAVVARLCTRVLVLEDGVVVEEGRPADLLADPRHPLTRDLVAAARAGELA
ncbi:ABC transporter-like, partial [Klenkia terrae]